MINNLTIDGYLGADPEFRFTQTGIAVSNFSIGHTPRTYDKESGEWQDGETLWLRGTLWRDAAENVANSLKKGDAVLVTGKIKLSSYTGKDGEQKTSLEIDIENIGPSIMRATVEVTKNSKSASPQSQKSAPAAPKQRKANSKVPASVGVGAEDDDPF